jgi:hypothetical protein
METTYSSYYSFGHSDGDPIWLWKNWQHVVPLLQTVVDLSSGVPSIATNLHDANGAPVKFGRMSWNLKHNEKWSTQCAIADILFFDTEIAFPSRNKCHTTRGLEPEILIFVENGNLLKSADRNVDQSIIIHISNQRLDVNSLPVIGRSIDGIRRLLNTRIAGDLERPLAFPSKYGMGYTDAIWHGGHGVLNGEGTDFSDDFKGYGITELRRDMQRI